MSIQDRVQHAEAAAYVDKLESLLAERDAEITRLRERLLIESDGHDGEGARADHLALEIGRLKDERDRLRKAMTPKPITEFRGQIGDVVFGWLQVPKEALAKHDSKLAPGIGMWTVVIKTPNTFWLTDAGDICLPSYFMPLFNPPAALTPQESANDAWEELGSRMGFDHMTVEPTGKGDRFFRAMPKQLAATEQPI